MILKSTTKSFDFYNEFEGGGVVESVGFEEVVRVGVKEGDEIVEIVKRDGGVIRVKVS